MATIPEPERAAICAFPEGVARAYFALAARSASRRTGGFVGVVPNVTTIEGFILLNIGDEHAT